MVGILMCLFGLIFFGFLDHPGIAELNVLSDNLSKSPLIGTRH